MADYEVGNILVSLETTSENTIDSLNKVEKQLNSFSKRLKEVEKINIAKVELSLERISKFKFNNIVKAFSPLQNLDSKSITSFGSAIRSIDKITNLGKVSVDFEKIEENVKKLTIAVDPFVQKMVQAEPSLRAFANALDLQKVNGQLMVAEARVKAINSKAQSKKVLDDIKIEKANIQLEKTKNKLDDIKNKSEKTSKSFGSIFNIGKLYFLFNYTKRFTQTLSKAMTLAIDFNETLNKFQVSMGQYYSDSIKFVNKITYAFNLSTESIMNYMSTFKNMLDALGNLEAGVSYELSESLTQMAIDYASLFNVSIDRAMQQFQSVLSGQIRSIRTTSGYDVSEATIFNIYQQLGGTKTMRQLSQLEKRLLRILAVQQQLERTGAVGDFTKTINQSANLLKQIGETLKEIGRWFGQLTMVYLQPFLTKLLGGLIAIREVLKSINIAKGYQYEDFKDGLFGDVQQEAEETEEAIKSLQRAFLGFDRINTLGSNGSINALGEDTNLILDAIKKYESNIDSINNKSNQIAENMLDWLGYEKRIDTIINKYGEKIEQVSWNLKDGYTNIEKIITGFGILIGLPIIKRLVKISNFMKKSIINPILKLIKKIKFLPSETKALFSFFKTDGIINTLKVIAPNLTKFAKIFGAIGVVATLIVYLKKLFEKDSQFAKTVTSLWNNFKETFNSIWNIITSIFEILKPIYNNVLKPILNIILLIFDWSVKTFAKLQEWIWWVIKWIFKGVEYVYQGIKWLIDALKKVQDFFSSFKVNLGDNKEKNKNLFEKLKIPFYAKGGVVSKPTVAMVGEYSGARSNPEIITPESKMRQVMLETTVPLMQAILNGNRELVNTIKNNPTILYVDSTKLAETTYKAYESTAKRLGKNNVVFNN